MSENLPDGKTCADCVSFKRICEITGVEADQRSCNWHPSRFEDDTWDTVGSPAVAMQMPEELHTGLSALFPQICSAGMVLCTECMYYFTNDTPNGGECRARPPVIVPGLGTQWPTPNGIYDTGDGCCGAGMKKSPPNIFPKK